MQNVLAHPEMTVFQPSGHINASNAETLRESLMVAISTRQYSTVIVDMNQVQSLDSAGLMALVSAMTLAQKLEQRFLLCSVSPSIRIIFELTQLIQVFEILDERPELLLTAA